ncbi:MAG TPA: PKD domain-containing protein [Methanophagales archaeon]|nr:PKD domain-containing protein [Methanophagales archaeon]
MLTRTITTGILFGLMIVTVILVSTAIADSNAKQLVTVYIETQDDVDKLSDLGLDIWEVDQGRVIARAYDRQILDLKGKGFTVELLSEKKIGKQSVQAATQTATPATYHSYNSLKTDLQNLEYKYPNIAKVYDIGDSWEKTEGIANRDILAIKISDNVTDEEEDEPDILFMGGTHAREWISVEVPFYLAKFLADHYNTDQKVRQMVDSREIWIVPLVNPDGLEYSRTEDRYWRKNRRDNGDGTFGVDPNRNFGYNWGLAGSSGDPESETYRGVAPFSEPETQAIRELVSAHDFSSSISYHSYSQLVLYPWGYTWDATPHEDQLSEMAEDMANAIKEVYGKNYTAEQASDLYITSGGSDDWLYGSYNIAAFTIELRPEDWQDNVDNPFVLSEDQIIPTWEENIPAALYLIAWSQQLDAISPAKASFVYYPEDPIINQTISFNASNSTDGEIERYDWDFGDEATGTGQVVTHSYSSAGDYAVKLIVTDDKGATSSTTEVIRIGIPIVTSVSVENHPEVSEGDNFTATVNIDDVSALAVVMFKLSYDPSVIRLTNVENGSDISSWSSWLEERGVGTVNVFAFSGFSGLTLEGSAELARLEFTVVGEIGDKSDIGIQGILGNSDLEYIQAIWWSSEIAVGA